MSWVNPSYRDPIPPLERRKYIDEEKKWIWNHNILIDHVPHPQSLASLVKLCRYYRRFNGHMYRNKQHWQRFRKNFIAEQLKQNGILKCYKCKKILQHLWPDKVKDYVTVDHIIPLHKNGDIKDYNNMRIACGPCNHTRQDY